MFVSNEDLCFYLRERQNCIALSLPKEMDDNEAYLLAVKTLQKEVKVFFNNDKETINQIKESRKYNK